MFYLFYTNINIKCLAFKERCCLILFYFFNENNSKQSPSWAAAHLQANTHLWMNLLFEQI